MADHWKVHVLPGEPSAPPETPKQYVVVLDHPDPRGFGWRRQLRGTAETGKETEGLTAEEARAIARALNVLIARAERVHV